MEFFGAANNDALQDLNLMVINCGVQTYGKGLWFGGKEILFFGHFLPYDGDYFFVIAHKNHS